MRTQIMIYPSYFDHHSAFFDELEDKLMADGLRYYASLLLEKGITDQTILERALEKAIHTCAMAGLPPVQHFRVVFIATNTGLKIDWLVSDLGLQLILLSADVSDPSVARWQINILSNGYGRWTNTLQ